MKRPWLEWTGKEMFAHATPVSGYEVSGQISYKSLMNVIE